MASAKFLPLLPLLFILLNALPAHSLEFQVGGDDGWTIPSIKNTNLYNDWASNNRFKIGDILTFNYKKDSVMVVTEDEYNKCRSSHPLFYSNNGRTEYTLGRSGLFYFISGVSGHCERGEKMIIRVLSHADAPAGSAGNETVTAPPPPGSSSDVSGASSVAVHCLDTVKAVAVLLFGSFFF